jgi:hypothetical protein
VERTKQGWMENYFGRMKQVFGFGAKLFWHPAGLGTSKAERSSRPWMTLGAWGSFKISIGRIDSDSGSVKLVLGCVATVRQPRAFQLRKLGSQCILVLQNRF